MAAPAGLLPGHRLPAAAFVAVAPVREMLASVWVWGGVVVATLFGGLAVLALAMLVVVLLA